MTNEGRPSAQHVPGEFAAARAQAEADTLALRGRAARKVADQARDAEDLRSLLAMLGLDDQTAGLAPGLAGYVRAVAALLGVPAEATGFEVSDTLTAYLGLSQRWALRPSRDLMLAWDERQGWFVAVETNPGEQPMIIAYLGGDDIVPHPHTVARFVTDVIGGRRVTGPRPAFPTGNNREKLAGRLTGYVRVSTRRFESH